MIAHSSTDVLIARWFKEPEPILKEEDVEEAKI